MLTQHKGLLPEMVKTESLNNQNEQLDRCIFKVPLYIVRAVRMMRGARRLLDVKTDMRCVLPRERSHITEFRLRFSYVYYHKFPEEFNEAMLLT